MLTCHRTTEDMQLCQCWTGHCNCRGGSQGGRRLLGEATGFMENFAVFISLQSKAQSHTRWSHGLFVPEVTDSLFSLSGLHSWGVLKTSLYSSRTILTSPATTIRRKHLKHLAVCISYLGCGTKGPKPREPENYKSFISLPSVDRESGSVFAGWFWLMVFPELSVRASVGSRFA